MELKRYVLLKTKSIVDTQNDTNFIYELKLISVAYLKKVSEVIDDLVEKSSDNILDLVEVGDLVEWKYGIAKVSLFASDNSGLICTSPHDWVEPQEVMAICKKQPNGDYKRYEVKA